MGEKAGVGIIREFGGGIRRKVVWEGWRRRVLEGGASGKSQPFRLALTN